MKVKRSHLHLADLVVVAALHLRQLSLKGLVMGFQGLDLQGAGLQLSAVLRQLVLGLLQSIVVASRHLRHTGELGAVPFLRLLLVPGGERLVLDTNVLQGHSEVRLTDVHLNRHLSVKNSQLLLNITQITSLICDHGAQNQS